jgi:hypothetical protein
MNSAVLPDITKSLQGIYGVLSGRLKEPINRLLQIRHRRMPIEKKQSLDWMDSLKSRASDTRR